VVSGWRRTHHTKPTGEDLMINDLIKVAGTMGEVVELVGVLIIFLGFIYAFFSVFFIKKEKNEERVVTFRTLIKKICYLVSISLWQVTLYGLSQLILT
jgi:hypothetical protein